MRLSLRSSPSALATAIVLALLHLAPGITTVLPHCAAAPAPASARSRTTQELAKIVILAHAKKSSHHGGGGGGGHHVSGPSHKHDIGNIKHRQTVKATRRPENRGVVTFSTAGGIVDEDWFDLGVTRLEVAIHDPVVSIAQSTPGVQCTFTGEKGGVFVVNHRAPVQVAPPQSFVRAECKTTKVQV
ncbi:hypothetical protein Micbo1qcDRAFT_178939 [Microdochium bolleyi]|uniref:Uncharacterized protein n=1 Tax=Microdochium bolleyi TaxID=196109 RepID=A0A136IR76_9PEZI|nr:hypothetical protein Micbo1qcDRAFT_178939 [Microdochium bolleyi]